MDRRSLLLGAVATTSLWGRSAASAEPASQEPDQPAERVLGIGGLFFRSHNPKILAEWYQRHLGINRVPTGAGQHGWRQTEGATSFAPFPMDSDYFGSPDQAWMVNFRVRNLEAMVAQLRAAGIAVKVDPTPYPYGRFARLQDPEGNPIELWEPAGSGT